MAPARPGEAMMQPYEALAEKTASRVIDAVRGLPDENDDHLLSEETLAVGSHELAAIVTKQMIAVLMLDLSLTAWRSMESAPRDSEPIMVNWGGGRLHDAVIVHWHEYGVWISSAGFVVQSSDHSGAMMWTHIPHPLAGDPPR